MKLLDMKSFEKNQPQTYMDQVFFLIWMDERYARMQRSYAMIPLTLHHLLKLENP